MFNCTGNVEVLCSFVFVIERWAAAQLRLESLACPLEKPLEQTGAKEPNWLMGLGRPPLRSWVLKDRVDVNRERERGTCFILLARADITVLFAVFPLRGWGNIPEEVKCCWLLYVCVCCVDVFHHGSRLEACSPLRVILHLAATPILYPSVGTCRSDSRKRVI